MSGAATAHGTAHAIWWEIWNESRHVVWSNPPCLEQRQWTVQRMPCGRRSGINPDMWCGPTHHVWSSDSRRYITCHVVEDLEWIQTCGVIQPTMDDLHTGLHRQLVHILAHMTPPSTCTHTCTHDSTVNLYTYLQTGLHRQLVHVLDVRLSCFVRQNLCETSGL